MNRTERPLILGTVFSFLLFLFSAQISAQSGSTGGASGPMHAEQRMAIPVGNITREAQTAEDALNNAKRDLLEPEFNLQIAEELKKIEETIQTNQKPLETALTPPLSHEGLQQQKLAWQSLREEIENTIGLLEERINKYQSHADRIDIQTTIWKKTRTEARRESAPRAIINRTNSVLKTLRTHETILRKARNETLNLQNHAAGILDSVDKALADVNATQLEIEKGIFSPQADPVWRLEPDTLELAQQLEITASYYSQMRVETVHYIQSNLDRIIMHGLFVVVLGWILQRKRRVLEHAEYDANETDTRGAAYSVLCRPWAAALLLGVLLATFTFPDRVFGFKLLTAIVGVSAWLRVISSLLSTAFLGPIVIFALIALSDLFRMSFSGYGALNRTLLTLIIFFAIAALFWFRRLQQKFPLVRTTEGSFWFGIFGGWIRLCQILLVLALVAVLLGFTLLSERLETLVLWGSILASAFIVSVLLVESLLQSLVEERRFDGIRMVRADHNAFLRVVRVALRLIGFGAWVYLVLRNVKLLSSFQEWTSKILSSEFGIEPVIFTIGDILGFALTLWISWLLARFLTFALDQEVFTRLPVGTGVPFAVTTFTRYTILVVGFLAALAILGFPLDKVTLLLSALGVGIGFGLQNITNNFISGIILLFERPIRVGDKIQLADLVGTVASIGIRASTVRGFDGSDVIVPNGDLISARVTNWTLADQKRRIVLPMQIAYGSDPEKVLELLRRIASDHTEVLETPAPEALFRNLGPNAMEFELRTWTESERGWMAVMSDLALATVQALKESEIQIALPQRDIKIGNLSDLRKALSGAIEDDAGKTPDFKRV